MLSVLLTHCYREAVSISTFLRITWLTKF